jgi:hypothetical protein
MGNYCVVVASGAQARFFILEPAEFPELGIGPNLVERGELINPEKEIARRDLYTDSKTGRGRAPHGGPSHGYDDHRSQHEDELERRFARKVLEKTDSAGSYAGIAPPAPGHHSQTWHGSPRIGQGCDKIFPQADP